MTTADFSVYAEKEVVEEVEEDPLLQISLAEAR